MPTTIFSNPVHFAALAEALATGQAFLADAKRDLGQMAAALRPRHIPARTTMLAPATALLPDPHKKISDLSGEVNRVFGIITDRIEDAEKLSQNRPAEPKRSGGWSEERRAKQSAFMLSRQPWKNSTGPRTAEGKARASQNARKTPVETPKTLHRAAVRANTICLRTARRIHRQYFVFLRSEIAALARRMKKKPARFNSSFAPPAHTLNSSFLWTREQLAACENVDDPAREARWILKHYIASATDAAILSQDETPITPEQSMQILSAVCKRECGEPLGRILGHTEFWSLPFRVTSDVLDPRADTETLIEAVVKSFAGRPAPESILDLGTGSGCILIALLTEFPQARGVGVDISDAALKIAQENAFTNNVADRAEFIKGDWFNFPHPILSSRGEAEGSFPVDASKIPRFARDDSLNKFELILSNPPYIESGIIPNLDIAVRKFDPMLALDGGADGLNAYKRIVDALPNRLTPGGLCFLEIGAGQARGVSLLCEQSGLSVLESYRDPGGHERVLKISLGTK